jgi:hypothetical protein
MDLEKRFYEMACAFPTMNRKGVQEGDIPGISKGRFNADELAEFVYNGGGCAWSTGEKLVLEFLLNLCNPGAYEGFNLGHALNVWDLSHMTACLMAMAKMYKGD